MAEDQSKGKKRSRGYYARSSQGKKMMRRGGALEAGMRGFLLTCNRQEAFCVRDGYALLGQYADQLYGPERMDDDDSDNNDDKSTSENESDPEDIEASIKKEVAQMKRKRAKKTMRFQSMDSGAKNVIFIRTKLPDPTELVHHILSDLARTKTCRCRHVLRLLPVAVSCRADADDIAKHAPALLGPHFHAEGATKAATFAVRIKIRNNGRLGRDAVIKTLAAAVTVKGPGHKVDLDRPELTIVVEVVRNVCCMSVVRNFEELRRYNVQEIVAADASAVRGSAAPGRIAQSTKDLTQKASANLTEASSELLPEAGRDQENPCNSPNGSPKAESPNENDGDEAKLDSEENSEGQTTNNSNTISSPTD